MSNESAVARVSEALNQTLEPDRDVNAEPRDHFSPIQVRFPVNAPALRPQPPAAVEVAAMAAFEDQNGVDDEKALSNALSLIKGFEWKPTNINFYFNQLETKMTTAGVKKNWTKFQVLTTVLPSAVQDELISTLQKSEADFPENNAYKILGMRLENKL